VRIQTRLLEIRQQFGPVIAFWTKINNDWIFNWAAALAYTLLTSIFPLFLVILAVGGFVLGALSVSSLTQLENALAGGLPGGAGGAGGEIVRAVIRQLNQSAGIYLAVGVVGAIVAGSGLFLSLESVFGIVFRLRGRDPIPQRIMAISMVLLYVILVPVMVAASILPSTILAALPLLSENPAVAPVVQAVGVIIAFISAFLFFGVVYFFVPNRRMKFEEIWLGTLLSAALLVLYERLFPIYDQLFLRNNSGSIVGFVVIILIFFYYLAFILLLGAEVNSMVLGLRPTTASLGGLLQELQRRDIMIEAPDAYAVPAPSGSASSGPGNEPVAPPATSPPHLENASPVPPGAQMTARQRMTLFAVLVAGAVTLVPLLRLGKRLFLE
jgi:membrane protein